MKYKLLVILLFLSIFSNAQKVWDKETYAAMCKKHLNEVLAHTYDLVMDGKLDAYQNDSFTAKLTINELKEKFSDKYAAKIVRSSKPKQYRDTIVIFRKDPYYYMVGFNTISLNPMNHSESTSHKIVGISLLYPSKSPKIDFGIQSLCCIKWEEIIVALSKEKQEWLLAYIQTAIIFRKAEFKIVNSEATIQLESKNVKGIQNYYISYNIQMSDLLQKAITSEWHNQYIKAAYLAFNEGKSIFNDSLLLLKIENIELELGNEYATSVGGFNGDPFEFEAYSYHEPYDWTSDKFILLQLINNQMIVQFRRENKWFNMKLEDLLPYLPKEVLPSLELLKKQ